MGGGAVRRDLGGMEPRTIVWTVVLALAGLATLVFLLAGRSRRRITRGRISRMLRLGRLSAYLWTSWLGAKIRRRFSSAERRVRYDEARRKADAEAVVRTMGQMKGAVMKLGQILSFTSDAIPVEYRDALKSLQAEAPPMDFALIRDVAERELGQPLERVFARFDEQPLAAASIGQVHRARLRSGEDVAVKIQYPGVAEAIESDMANSALLYRMVSLFYPALDPGPVIDEMTARLVEELDYRNEARNQRAFHDLYRDHPFVRVPQVYEAYSTDRVLTTELVEGRHFDEVAHADHATRARFAEILYRFVFGSIFRYGVFNGDPHPGNYLYDDQGRVVFLDFGCVKYFPEQMLDDWVELVVAYLDGDRARFREQAVALGFITADSEVTAEQLFGYFGYFYEPFTDDRPYTFTDQYNNASLGMVFKPGGEFAGLHKRLNMPPDFVLANRIQWGVVSILTLLAATGNWHRIHRELVLGDPPSTELGRQDSAWTLVRGLERRRLLLRQEGPVERSPATTSLAVAAGAAS